MRVLYGLAIICLFFTGQCEKFPEQRYAIMIDNKSNHYIQFFDASAGAEHIYPDTVIISKRPAMQEAIPDSRRYIDSSIPWKDIFSTELPGDTLSLYIFHSDTLAKYPWQTVRDEYKILKRYDLSLKDLELLDFTVPYPPSTKMKNMKMFPAYHSTKP